MGKFGNEKAHLLRESEKKRVKYLEQIITNEFLADLPFAENQEAHKNAANNLPNKPE